VAEVASVDSVNFVSTAKTPVEASLHPVESMRAMVEANPLVDEATQVVTLHFFTALFAVVSTIFILTDVPRVVVLRSVAESAAAFTASVTGISLIIVPVVGSPLTLEIVAVFSTLFGAAESQVNVNKISLLMIISAVEATIIL